MTTSVFFVNCALPFSESNSGNSNPTNSGHNTDNQTIQMSLISEEKYSFLNKQYKMQLGKITNSSLKSPIYFQWISNCTQKCATVVISEPYAGIDWTDDPKDKDWINKANSYNGINVLDTEGPPVPGIDENLGYLLFKSQDKQQSAAAGALYLENNLSVLIIYNRFFRGRNFNDYVLEHSTVVKYFIENSKIDSANFVYFGASLGGGISLYSAMNGDYAPKALVLLTPLIDLKRQLEYTQEIQSKSISEQKKNSYKDFFAPYLRRIIDNYTTQAIASKLKSNSLIIHDTWDTLVPYQSSWELYVELKNNNSLRSDMVLYQHAQAIDFEQFALDHSQPNKNEGYLLENSFLFFYNYIVQNLRNPTDAKINYYDYAKTLKMLSEFKSAQDRGQNIQWIKNRFKDLCHSNIQMVDTSNAVPAVSGDYFIQQILKNIWGKDFSIDTVCAQLDSIF